MLADAFEALKTFDWGTDLAVVAPIDDAAVAPNGERGDLERRLIAALSWSMSRDAKDYVCRKLAIVGTPAAVPGLAMLLVEPDHSHMARFALERISGPESTMALLGALSKVKGNLKIGVINSLGARRDAAAIPLLSGALKDNDPAVARAAALALGAIGTVEAAAILQSAQTSGSGHQQAVVDGLLTCADGLMASNNKGGALSIYQSLSGEQNGRLVRLAATRGLLACASKPG